MLEPSGLAHTVPPFPEIQTPRAEGGGQWTARCPQMAALPSLVPHFTAKNSTRKVLWGWEPSQATILPD